MNSLSYGLHFHCRFRGKKEEKKSIALKETESWFWNYRHYWPENKESMWFIHCSSRYSDSLNSWTDISIYFEREGERDIGGGGGMSVCMCVLCWQKGIPQAWIQNFSIFKFVLHLLIPHIKKTILTIKFFISRLSETHLYHASIWGNFRGEDAFWFLFLIKKLVLG